jgi:phage FluMu protein Com
MGPDFLNVNCARLAAVNNLTLNQHMTYSVGPSHKLATLTCPRCGALVDLYSDHEEWDLRVQVGPCEAPMQMTLCEEIRLQAYQVMEAVKA